MNPFFFGASDRALFGIYHPPASQPARNVGVVICNPFGDEAIKAHRALLQLARMLSAERFHVLRFDYFATGDSMGEGVDGTLEQWRQDIGDAATELKDVSGVSKVSFAGLRLGGSLALQAASGRRDVATVALWDPIVNGQSYVDDLYRYHAAYLDIEFGHFGPRLNVAGFSPDEVMGFPLGGPLKKEILSIDLCTETPKRLKRGAMIVSTNDARYKGLREHLDGQGISVDYEHVPVGVNWNADEALEASLVPKEALQAIVKVLS